MKNRIIEIFSIIDDLPPFFEQFANSDKVLVLKIKSSFAVFRISSSVLKYISTILSGIPSGIDDNWEQLFNTLHV